MYTYLIHLHTKIHHAGHYVGATNDIESRLKQHAVGNGARLLEVAMERDITWELAKLWTSDDAFGVERVLKRRHNGRKYCPLCNNGKVQWMANAVSYPIHLLPTNIQTTGQIKCTTTRTKES